MNDTVKYCSTFNPDSSETVAYNNPLFPAYIRSGVLSSYPDYSSISHWHEDLEFIWVQKGAMTYNVNGELVELTEGTGIMVNSRQLHYGFSAEHNECIFTCILLSPELLQGNAWFYQNCIERVTQNPAYPYLYLDRNSWRAPILHALEKMNDLADLVPTPSPLCFDIIENFITIMRILYENFDMKEQSQSAESLDLNAIRNMITYIEEHYAEHITLEDIALAGTCCKSKCSLLFKKYLRDTPITYTTKFRLRESLSSLLSSKKNITDIAYEYGFNGASYYCETFKKYYGISPLLYKKSLTQKP